MIRTKYANIILFSIFTGLSGITLSPSAVATINKHATVFDISTKFYVDDKLLASPHTIQYANQEAKVSISAPQSSLDIAINARNISKSGVNEPIAVKYYVNYKNGNCVARFNPKLILKSGQPGQITFKDKKGVVYKVNVVAIRQMKP